MEELKIHDIKTIVHVPDYSIYLYYGVFILGAIVILLSIYKIYSFWKHRQVSQTKEYINILENLDMKTPKESAYTISKYGRILANNDRSKKLIEELHSVLEEYKYKKYVPESLPNSIKTKVDLFLESLDD